MKNLLFISLLFITIVSCTTVDSGHRGVEVEWGGQTNMNTVYPEGMNVGLHWIWDDMVEYDIREKTITNKFEFNDKNNMLTPVEVSVDYSLVSDKVNVIHARIGKDQLDVKIITTLSSAAKQVIPQYSATELNLNKREEAENAILRILKDEFPDFNVNCSRVRITDVDIPKTVADAAQANAEQQELNKLALSKVTQSKNNYEAAGWDAKTKAILSRPEMIELKKLEIEELWAKKGVSRYGNNNVFGAGTTVIKGL